MISAHTPRSAKGVIHSMRLMLLGCLCLALSGQANSATSTTCEAVPIGFTSEGQLMLPIRVNQRSLEVELDGGAVSLILSPSALQRVRAQPTSRSITVGGLEGSRQARQIHLIREMRIGTAIFRDVDAIADFAWGVGSNGPKAHSDGDGTLGLISLVGRSILIDVPGRRLGVGNVDDCLHMLPDNHVVFPLQLDEDGLSVQLRFDGTAVRLNFDIGSTASFVKPSSLPANASLEPCSYAMPEGAPCRAYTPGNVSGVDEATGHQPLTSPTLLLLPIDQIEADGLLGIDYLQDKVVLLDLANKRLFLARRAYK